MKNSTVKEVLQSIESQSEFYFMYSEKLVDVQRNVSVNAKNKKVKDVLDELFAGTEVSYKIKDRFILLTTPEVRGQDFAAPQDKSVTGKVTDSSGLPLPGATVVVKGTTNGTVTNFDGEYTISNVPDDAVLQFSFVGMMTQEIAVAGNTVINATMVEDAIGIEEVVAVGFATQKKVNLTGSVGTVDMDAMESRPVSSATQMLQGVVPGLNITQSGGTSLDAEATVNIRGVTTIGEGSTGSPLILIDGMEGDINIINPQDIENISVLKDAAASSIYGSRAPFGVILVTTKSGKSGDTQINYNNSFRFNSPISMPNMMNSMDFATYFNDALTNGGETVWFDDERLERIQQFMDGDITATTVVDEDNPTHWGAGYKYGNDNVDWYDALFRDRVMAQEHNISISGGSDKLKFYCSGNFLEQSGFMEFNQDNLQRFTTTLKLSGKIRDNVTVNLLTRFIRKDYERPVQLTYSTLFQNLARQGWPVLPLYDPNGYLFDSPAPALGLRDGGDYTTQDDYLYQQGQIVFEPIIGWKIFADINYRTQNEITHYDQQVTYNHDIYGDPYSVDETSGVYEYSYRDNYYSSNVYSEYVKSLKSGHNFKAMIGFQAELDKLRDFSAYRQGLISSDLTAIDVTSGTDYDGDVISPEVSGSYENWSTCGYFGRINYNYKEKYLLEINGRYDGTSRFRSDKRWKFFPSVSAGWNLAYESFWERMKDIVSVMKVRVSYGELGNQNTSDSYPTYELMTTGTADGDWLVNGAQPNTASAPTLVSQYLTWERIRSWNVGLDFRMFDSRLSTSFDYFTRYTDDMVGPAEELPATLGTDVPDLNNTDLKTYGFELDINWNDRLDNGFGYSVKFMLADSQSKITRYPNSTGTLELDDFDDPDIYRTGQMVGEIWGYVTKGIAQTDEEMNAHLESLPNGGQDALGTSFAAGDIMYKDLNGDKEIDNGAGTIDDHGDLKIIGNNTARFNVGLDLSANYEGFDFRAFFQGVLKRDYFQDSYYFWGAGSSGKWWSTGFEEHKDYFRNDPDHRLGKNLDSYYARPLFGSIASKNQQSQTRYLQDASYIRLKNIQLGYTLPASLTQKVMLRKVRVFVSGENLITFTNLTSIFDPETVGGGYGGNVYPLSKVYALGLSVNF